MSLTLPEITFSTCWYVLDSKFPPIIYRDWIQNLLSNVCNFYLVVYTDELSKKYIEPFSQENPERIKMVILPFTEFYNARYTDKWIENHSKNWLLNQTTEWRLNMLWAEKTAFVLKTMQIQIFPKTDFYGWMDIGYWRGREHCDTPISELKKWPDTQIIRNLSHYKIHYALVNNDKTLISELIRSINIKNPKTNLPFREIEPMQFSIAGGFFILHANLVKEWQQMFDDKLRLYFEHNYLVKDDQIIIADCIFSNMSKFVLHREEKTQYDNWFMFQRLLSSAQTEN